MKIKNFFLSSATLGLTLAMSPSAFAATDGAAFTAKLEPKSASKAKGTAKLNRVGKANIIEIDLQVEGLKPNSKHAFHVHEKGDCSAPDASSAGDHFNPGGHNHGKPSDTKESHAGDLGNITADANGRVNTKLKFPNLSLDKGAENSIAGLALVIHAGEDDFKSQPAGNAGGRIACGVIGNL